MEGTQSESEIFWDLSSQMQIRGLLENLYLVHCVHYSFAHCTVSVEMNHPKDTNVS